MANPKNTHQVKSLFKLRSIQTKLTLSFVLILVPVVTLISFLAFRNAKSLLSDRIFEQLESTATNRQESISQLIANDVELAQSLTTSQELLDNIATASSIRIQNEVKLGEFLSTTRIQNSQVEKIWIYDREGDVISENPQEETSVELAQLPVFSGGGRFAISEADGGLFVSGPISNSAEPIGSLVMKVDATRLLPILHNYSGLGLTGELIIGERKEDEVILFGNYRHQQGPDQVRINIGENPRLPIVLATQKLSGTTIARDYRGVEVVASYKPLPFSNWGMVTKIDSDEAFAPVETLEKELIQVSFLTLLLFLLVASAASRSITTPLQRLHIGTEKIGKGEWDYRLDIHSGDEVEQLATEFTNMAQQLKRLYAGLEEKVSERTAQLEKEKETSERLAQDLKKFELAVENASDQIIITDQDANILYANKAIRMVSGYQIDEVIGKKPGKLWGRQMKKEFYQAMWKRIKEEKKTWEGEVKNMRKNGKEYFAALAITPILDPDGNVRFYVGVERDITKAKEIDRMKTEFISVASHQLRTPLSAIKWFTEMLLSGDAGELSNEQKEYLAQVSGSNERMIELVNSLLNVSRIEQGRIAIEPEPTDLVELVNQALAELRPKIEEKKLQVAVSAHQNLPKVSIDPKLIRQAYANLLSNAVKYTPENGDITVLVSRKGDEVISQIQDTGYGIPEDQQDQVFTKFFRADNIRSISTEGTGLGLYIVKSVIESSGGKIWFQSEEGKGTTFWFTLPLTGSPEKKGDRTLEEVSI